MLNWFLSLFKPYRDGDVRFGRINWHLDTNRYSINIFGSTRIVNASLVNDTKDIIPTGTVVTIIHQDDAWFFHVPVWL